MWPPSARCSFKDMLHRMLCYVSFRDVQNRWPKHAAGYAVPNTINLHFSIRSCWLYFSYISCIYTRCLKKNTNCRTRQPVSMSVLDPGAPSIRSRGASRYSMAVYWFDLNPVIALHYCVQDLCGWLLNASLYTYHIRCLTL